MPRDSKGGEEGQGVILGCLSLPVKFVKDRTGQGMSGDGLRCQKWLTHRGEDNEALKWATACLGRLEVGHLGETDKTGLREKLWDGWADGAGGVPGLLYVTVNVTRRK